MNPIPHAEVECCKVPHIEMLGTWLCSSFFRLRVTSTRNVYEEQYFDHSHRHPSFLSLKALSSPAQGMFAICFSSTRKRDASAAGLALQGFVTACVLFLRAAPLLVTHGRLMSLALGYQSDNTPRWRRASSHATRILVHARCIHSPGTPGPAPLSIRLRPPSIEEGWSRRKVPATLIPVRRNAEVPTTSAMHRDAVALRLRQGEFQSLNPSR